jgi:hypothetical protein
LLLYYDCRYIENAEGSRVQASQDYDCLVYGFHFDSFLRNVFNSLSDLQGFDVKSLSEEINSDFGKIFCFDLYSNSKEKIIFSLKNFNSPPSKEMISLSLKASEMIRNIFMPSVDRVFLKPISFLDREMLLHEYSTSWAQFFSKFGLPKLIVFESSPHMPWDITLLGMCLAHGIKVRIIQRTLLKNRIILRPPTFLNTNENFKGSPPNGQSDIDKNRKMDDDGDSSWLIESKKINENFLLVRKQPFVFRVSKSLVYIFLSLFESIFGRIAHYWNYSRISIFIFTIRWWRNVFKSRIALTKVESLDLPTDNFIYFALHYQPERSTVPEAGDYWNQYKAIATLASCLPNGWKIVIREHPRQIGLQKTNLRTLNYRNSNFYFALSRLPNTTFVSSKISSDDLIMQSKLCSTCTGSTGWEALEKGRPVIVFGQPFYSECEAVEIVDNLNNLPQQIDSLLSLSEKQVKEKFNKFRKSLIRNSIVSSNQSEFISDINIDEYEENLVKEILKNINSMYRM